MNDHSISHIIQHLLSTSCGICVAECVTGINLSRTISISPRQCHSSNLQYQYIINRLSILCNLRKWECPLKETISPPPPSFIPLHC